ncbi:MAG: hypothetical protein M1821_006648 [Bathelium mastoideum]|nr:MAG: hypothetical protein M1821_006648 [Bathelium mastoideum]
MAAPAHISGLSENAVDPHHVWNKDDMNVNYAVEKPPAFSEQAFLTSNERANSMCVLRVKTASERVATVGGTIQLDGEYYGLSVAHMFQPKTAKTEEVTPPDSPSDDCEGATLLEDEFLAYDEETMALIETVSAEYDDLPSHAELGLYRACESHMAQPEDSFTVELSDAACSFMCPELDLALINIPDRLLREPNCYSPMLSNQQYFFEHVAIEMPKAGKEVLLATTSGPIHACTKSYTKAIKIGNGVDVARAWVLKVNKLGDFLPHVLTNPIVKD